MSKYFKYLFAFLLIAVALFVITSKFKGVYYDIPALLREADKSLLIFLILFQTLNYFGDAFLSQTLLSVSGFKIKLRDTLKIAVFGVAGNHVAPFVGGTIFTYYSYKKINIPSAVISFLVFTWTCFVWLSYILFFLLSLILLPSLVFNFISLKSILIAIVVFALIFIFIFLTFRRRGKYLVWILNVLSVPLGKISGFFRKKQLFGPKLLEKFFSEFHQCFALLLKNKGKIPLALLFSFMFYSGDILTLYFAFLVFGLKINFMVLIFGYTLSLVLTAFSLVPGAPGIMEASLTMVFIKLGFPAHVSLFATLLFRLFSYWLPLPFGIFSYWKLKK